MRRHAAVAAYGGRRSLCCSCMTVSMQKRDSFVARSPEGSMRRVAQNRRTSAKSDIEDSTLMEESYDLAQPSDPSARAVAL
jgi:hypothetical protein